MLLRMPKATELKEEWHNIQANKLIERIRKNIKNVILSGDIYTHTYAQNTDDKHQNMDEYGPKV